MTTPYFEKYLGPATIAHCPGCDRALRLVHFRKWWGHKRLLRPLCETCEPQKKLSEMSPEERANAVHAGRTSLEIAQRINATHAARRAEATSTHISKGRLRENNKKRRLNWSRAILRTLTVERAWAERNLQNPASEEWERFFEAYARVLKDAIERINIKLRSAARGRGEGHLKPTMEEVDPRRWVFPETILKLKDMYSVCPVLRGRKPYRDPALLSW